LYVSKLQLQNFRNYHEIDLRAGPGNLLFIGENAQGKSNLLEALYLLATARSARASSDVEMVGWQVEAQPQPVARVAGDVERRAGHVQLEAAIIGPAPSLSGQSLRAGKRFRVNGIPRRAIDLIGNLHAVLFTAEDMQIIGGPPSERRRYLDLTISQLDRRYYAASQRYARVLQQRNAGLRRVKEGLASVDELAFWDESLVKEGAVIVSFRLRYAERLADHAMRAHAELSGEAAEVLETAYQPRLEGDWPDLGPRSDPAQAEAALRASLRSLQRREVGAGMTLAGPHRDEVAIDLNGLPASSFGSRAQVRTATLALKLAEARLLAEDGSDPPVLLLDDIVSELDEKRRRSVLAGITDFDQVWLTAADTAGLPPEFLDAADRYRVAGGKVEPA
jgi:DNA replication and repair protein RecF